VIIPWVNSIVRGGETIHVSATPMLYVAIYNLFSAAAAARDLRRRP
jgi:hypothetical protein